MKASNAFSVKRVVLLINRHLFYNLRTYLMSFSAAGSILIVISLLKTLTSNGYFSEVSFITLGKLFLFIGGILITSNIFKEISSKHRGWFYMILPANPSEKIFSYWLLTTIGYFIISSLTLIVSSLILSILSTLIFKTTFYIFNPFSVQYLGVFIHYSIAQSLFFFGAIYFRKNNFIKTVLSVFVFVIGLGATSVFIIYLLFGSTGMEMNNLNLSNDHFFTVILPYTAKTLYYGFMIPFFITVSYFKLKEREV